MLVFQKQSRAWIFTKMLVFQKQSRAWIFTKMLVFQKQSRAWIFTKMLVFQKQSRAWMSNERKVWLYDRSLNVFHAFCVVFLGCKSILYLLYLCCAV